jgi:hypothetical protein
MEPRNIAEYILSIIVDGQSRSIALRDAVIHFDIDVDGSMYREVLDALVELEREFDHDLWSTI